MARGSGGSIGLGHGMGHKGREWAWHWSSGQVDGHGMGVTKVLRGGEMHGARCAGWGMGMVRDTG